MASKIEKIKKIFTDARKLEVDFKNFFSPDLNGNYTNEQYSIQILNAKSLKKNTTLLVNNIHEV